MVKKKSGTKSTSKGTSKKQGTKKKPVQSKKKTTRPEPINPKKDPEENIPKRVRGKTGYREFVHEYSKWKKEEGIKSTGRGGHMRDAGRIWKDLKGKPGIIQNIDVILPQYFEPGKPKIPQLVGDGYDELKEAIIDANLSQFDWWLGVEYFSMLMRLPQWRGDYSVRIIDEEGQFKDIPSIDEYRRNIQTPLSNAYRKDQFGSESLYPFYIFTEITEDEGRTYVIYELKKYNFAGMPEEESERERIQEIKEAKAKEKAGPPPGEEKPPPMDIDRKIDILIKRKADLREDIKFYKENDMTEDLQAAKQKYKDLDQRIDDLTNQI